ncbi:MAG: cellulose biosynthesis protein BcsS [Ectothiorhodospiraceae bacterium]|nr:cellulose biosynthesis protein BcsS [Ectothiorhodospiraceae bacterium]
MDPYTRTGLGGHSLCVAIMVVVVLAVRPASADWMLLGGGETVFDGRFAQITALIPFSGQLGNGFVHRYSISYVAYEYPLDEGAVEATSWGGSIALGYQVPVNNGWFSLSAAAASRDTEHDPPQPDNPQAGARVVGQADIDAGYVHDNRWLLASSISYTPVDRAYWGRLRIMRRAGTRSFLGPEVVAHGDREYDAQHLGMALQVSRVFGALDLVFKAGGKRIEDGESGAYGGIEFLRHFQ